MKNFGFILINKPSGITSHDVVDYLRKITKIRKIGHSGTLDPFATGLLICGIGREATKRLLFYLKQDKEYIAELKLGAITNTYDRDGKVILTRNVKKPDLAKIKKVLKNFIGEINQIPPTFSAKKFKGRKLYQLARKGIEIKLEPKKVKIYNIELLDYDFPKMKIRVNCSSGVYIRSLANDIGRKLEIGAYLQELCRTKIGKLSLEKAIFLYDLNSKNWQNYLT